MVAFQWSFSVSLDRKSWVSGSQSTLCQNEEILRIVQWFYKNRNIIWNSRLIQTMKHTGRQWITHLIEGEDSRSRQHKCTCRRELSFCFHRLWYVNKLFYCESFIVLHLLDSIYTGWILFGLHGSAWSGNLSMYVEI